MKPAKAALLLSPATLVGIIFVPCQVALAAPEKVLKLPFTDPSVVIQQGWKYDYSSSAHEGIDFRKGNWETFEVVAAYGGELECVPDGMWNAYGNTCTVKHVINGHTFYTLYAHLESYAKSSGYVGQGEFLGMAGKTGHPDYEIHLHFEVQDNLRCFKGCRVDPYDIRGTADAYPGGANYGNLGLNHWWSDVPPALPGVPAESCNDGIQNQSETGIDCGGPCPPCNEPVCSNGDRRRCWIECIQEFPPECIHGGIPPLIFGIETCSDSQWGTCQVNNSCAEFADSCPNGAEYPVEFECVDETVKQGGYTCSGAIGLNCEFSYYGNWPYQDCSDLCFGSEACDVEGQERACEVYCDSPMGPKMPGVQDCRDVSCGTLVWSHCLTMDACLGI